MSKHLLLGLVFATFAASSSGLSVLILGPLPSTSHHIWITPLVKELLRRGHHVHYAGIHPVDFGKRPAQNYSEMVFENVMESLLSGDEYVPTSWTKLGVFNSISYTYEIGHLYCDLLPATQGAKQLLQLVKDTQFDVIVQDVTLSQCLYGLWEIAKGNPGIVGYIPYALAPWIKNFVGGSDYPAWRPFSCSAAVPPLTFWQRTMNVLYFASDQLFRQYLFMPQVQKRAEKYVGRELTPLALLEKKLDILLLNSHPSFEPGIPLPPNLIEVGGLHVQPPNPIDDKEIKSFLDGAKHGAVVISLGTNVAWDKFDKDVLRMIVATLSKLKQRILWKLGPKLSLDLPSNVMGVKWLAQNDVLGHENVKAIWTHAGLLSTQEAIWHGVPMIGMPFFMDQRPNMELLVSKRVAIRLDVDRLSAEAILDAFEKILYDTSYRDNMQRLSKEFRDRVVPPLDLAAWYIEYAARNPGGSLKSAGRDLSWIKSSLLDVYVFLLLIAMSFIWICRYLLKRVYNYCTFSKSSPVNLEKKRT